MKVKRVLTVVGAAMMAVAASGQISSYSAGTYALVAVKNGVYYAMTNRVSSGNATVVEVQKNADGNIVYLASKSNFAKINWATTTSSIIPYEYSDGEMRASSTKKLINNSSSKIEISTSSTTKAWSWNNSLKSWRFNVTGSTYYTLLYRDGTVNANEASWADSSYPGVKAYNLAPHTWRTLGASNFGTICLPQAVRADEVAGATFYEIAAKVVDAEDAFKGIVLEEVTGDLEAGTPYIFKRAGEATYIVAAMHGDVAESPVDNGGLVGVLSVLDEEEGFSVPAGKYILQGDQLWETTTYVDGETGETVSRSRLQAGRAYIDPDAIGKSVPEEDVASVKGLFLGLDDPFDQVRTLQEPPTCNIQYDLIGRRLKKQPSRQIIIHNGKKYLFK